jgi:RNase P/RNase MRP subunit p30
MKIYISEVTSKNVSLSLQAESDAELWQLKQVRNLLQQTKADWTDWDDMNGRSGVCIFAKKQESAKAHD